MSDVALSELPLGHLEVPNIRVVPVYYSSDGDLAEALAASYGLTPDPWQRIVLNDWLARDAVSHRWVNITCGLSVPRQNGKNAIIEMRELYGLVGWGEKILHTAHEVKTAMKAFKRLQHFFGEKVNDPDAKFPELNAMVKSIRNTNGQEAIFLKNGGSIELAARSKSSARGFTVDLVVFDEAQELSDDSLEALLATTTSAPLGNPQWIFTGTPPGPKADGEVFTRLRDEMLSGTSKRSNWNEWGAPLGADLDDRDLWKQVNPALGHRLHFDVIENERARYSDEGFLRERLGGWSAAVSNRVISQELWNLAQDNESMAVDRFALAIDVAPNMQSASVAIAGQRVDGGWHLDVGAQRAGADWVASWVNQFLANNPQVRAVVVDVASPAATIIDQIKSSKIRITTPTVREVGAGCARFLAGLQTGEVRHIGDSRLALAVDAGRRRTLGTSELWAWNRKDPESDITPLVAATLALWGAQQTNTIKPKINRTGNGRSGRSRRAAIA